MNEELAQIFEEVQTIYQLKKEQGDSMGNFEMRAIRQQAYKLRTFCRKTLTEYGQEVIDRRLGRA